MAKRKHDCSLNDIVVEHLRTSKCERTLKLFERQGNACNNAMYDDFVSYLKQNEVKKANTDEDLGFEVNFGAFQPEQKVIFQVIFNIYNGISLMLSFQLRNSVFRNLV